jgi:glycerol dehydrogenase
VLQPDSQSLHAPPYTTGEVVGWTTVVQLLMEGDEDEAERVMAWNKRVGLPMTYEDMCMVDVARPRLRQAVEAACAPCDTMHNMPFK